MNHRERLLRTLQFKSTDRIPLVEWPIRTATMRAWIAQGYPVGIHPNTFFGLDPFHIPAPIDLELRPHFQVQILEQTSKYKIWQDELGAIRKDFSKDETPGFVTRTWLSFPVKDRESFKRMQRRYKPNTPGRIPQNLEKQAVAFKKTSVATHLSIPFLFWTARDWMGFENLCITFYDDPKLIDAMFGYLTDFCIETLREPLKKMRIDIVELKEDMAYKNAPMISPAMFRRFMRPHYLRLIRFLKENGVGLVYVDCDGYPG